MKPALRAALGGGKVSAGVCVTIGNLNELISVGCVRFLVGLASVFMWGCMPCSWGIRGGIYILRKKPAENLLVSSDSIIDRNAGK